MASPRQLCGEHVGQQCGMPLESLFGVMDDGKLPIDHGLSTARLPKNAPLVSWFGCSLGLPLSLIIILTFPLLRIVFNQSRYAFSRFLC